MREPREIIIFLSMLGKKCAICPYGQQNTQFLGEYVPNARVREKESYISGESHSKARKFMGDYVIQKIAASIRAKG